MDNEPFSHETVKVPFAETKHVMEVAIPPKKVAKKSKTVKSRRKWKKASDKPKRPLSAYNFFFHLEREKIVLESMSDSAPTAPEAVASVLKERGRRPHRKSHGKIGFITLARTVAARWKALEPSKKAPFEEQAKKEKQRYHQEIQEWKKVQEERKKVEEESSAPAKPSSGKGAAFSQQVEPNVDDGLGVIRRSIFDQVCPLLPPSGESTPEIKEETIEINSVLPKTYTNLGSLYEEYADHNIMLGNINPLLTMRQNQIKATGVLSCLDELASELDDDCIDLLSAFRNKPVAASFPGVYHL